MCPGLGCSTRVFDYQQCFRDDSAVFRNCSWWLCLAYSVVYLLVCVVIHACLRQEWENGAQLWVGDCTAAGDIGSGRRSNPHNFTMCVDCRGDTTKGARGVWDIDYSDGTGCKFMRVVINKYMKVGREDDRELHEALAVIVAELQGGGKVLVHCTLFRMYSVYRHLGRIFHILGSGRDIDGSGRTYASFGFPSGGESSSLHPFW